jgi:hypothetical protein
MSEEPARSSHALMWALSVIAVPMLYLLSSPWVVVFFGANDAVMAYSAPFFWLRDSTPLTAPLAAYCKWCWTVAISLHWG